MLIGTNLKYCLIPPHWIHYVRCFQNTSQIILLFIFHHVLSLGMLIVMLLSNRFLAIHCNVLLLQMKFVL